MIFRAKPKQCMYDKGVEVLGGKTLALGGFTQHSCEVRYSITSRIARLGGTSLYPSYESGQGCTGLLQMWEEMQGPMANASQKKPWGPLPYHYTKNLYPSCGTLRQSSQHMWLLFALTIGTQNWDTEVLSWNQSPAEAHRSSCSLIVLGTIGCMGIC